MTHCPFIDIPMEAAMARSQSPAALKSAASPVLSKAPAAPRSFQDALAAYNLAHEAHEAACSAFGAIEARSFEGSIQESDAIYVAADAAVDQASDVEMVAFEAMIEAPVRSIAEARDKLSAFSRTFGRKASLDDPILPFNPATGCKQYDEVASLARIRRDLEALATPPAPSNETLAALDAKRRELEAALSAAETDEDGDPISAELAQVERNILALPCTGIEVVQAKLREVQKGLRSGELGGEEEALDDVIAWLGRSVTGGEDAICPVAALIPTLDAVRAADAAVWDAWKPSDTTLRPDIIAADAACEALQTKISCTQAKSRRGAGLQLALAFDRADLIRGNPDEDVRERHHVIFEGLMRSALAVLAPEITTARSEERRLGKECRSRWSPYD